MSQAHDEGFYNVGSIHDGDQANAPGMSQETVHFFPVQHEVRR